ncbi:MAG: bifunctional diaminohydroxyphosphoribosylaminopyrimidine deaminase/5-amino-6-(5-phosphoribosylamino)uracil reductase RibD [Myxococcota bacterium]|nr:bifunctional diaminohydroxyphosphoribosylaminopyrimidine deaminase/5-amino-6-(5-phosphoribosylamino)uracil reductase RibD [Myxococcota bacterium]
MNKGAPPFDPAYMREALCLARKSRPSPNPRVGAVVVKDGVVVGRGFHERPGTPHAEINALREAGPAARGADLYATLEPCCHHGKTGPCVEAIVSAGIARIAIGMVDPDSRVSGRGIAFLQSANLQVDVGIEQAACEQLLAGYIVHRTTGRSMIVLKAAITLDGYLATQTGDSKWISSKASRQLAHEMRADADAVLVGVGTVLADDPALTVRHCDGKTPLRVVVDSSLKTPTHSHLVSHASDEGPVLIAHTGASQVNIEAFAHRDSVETLACDRTSDGRVDLTDLVEKLSKRGILSVLVEGGSQIHGAFMQSGLADRLALFVAPRVLGSGIAWNSFNGVGKITEGRSLCDITATPVGPDVLIQGSIGD